MRYENFHKIIRKGLKDSPETMEFLRGQALEILEECRIDWENKCPKEDLNDPEAWWDYYHDAYKKFDKYFCSWLFDVRGQLPSIACEKKLPYSIAHMFENIIDEVLETIDLGEVQEIMNQVIEDEHENRKKNLCEAC